MKGVGLVQALSMMESARNKFINVATTSAAAIVVALFGAASTTTALSILADKGLYSGRPFAVLSHGHELQKHHGDDEYHGLRHCKA